MAQTRTIVTYVGAILAVAVLGYVSAQFAGAYLSSRKVEEAESTRRQYQRDFTAGVLRSMNTLEIGDVLPDYRFEIPAGPMTSLAEIANDHTMLIFFDPYCDGCDSQLAALAGVTRDSIDIRRFVLIASGDRDALLDKMQRLEIRSPVLYDESGDYFYQLGIHSFPFNVLIDQKREVKDIMAGSLVPGDLEHFIDSGQLD
ncbi:MAG: redoxin domain-containing protein [candidate division Zixibacteria bacterium]|nr:redoxin domain-containing protein [candidate division Zixibacteria bacterium]